MSLCRFHKAKFYMTAYLLWVTGCVSKKVYFECGARLDVTDARGLVLSPGFPYNYSSGTHCVWQFFVPAGQLLTLDMLECDIFKSNGDAVSVERSGGAADPSPVPDGSGHDRRTAKEPQPTPEHQQLIVQDETSRMETAGMSTSARPPERSSSQHPVPQRPEPTGALRSPAGVQGEAAVPPFVTTPTTGGEWDEGISVETQLSPADACPHDVLYISDLLTFSSRFCGSEQPVGSQLEFGSNTEMVEVILELITTTHWGRGFALLFYYRNWTQAPAAGQRSLAPSDGTVGVLLASVCGAAFITMAMSCALCLIFRPKICAKGSNTTSSINSEVLDRGRDRGRSSVCADGSELQLVAPSHPGQLNTSENDRHFNLAHTDSAVRSECKVSQNAELKCSSALTELEMGKDEVFVIFPRSNTAKAESVPHMQQQRFLRRSDTEPSQLRPAPESPDVSLATEGGLAVGTASRARPRAWSMRTFQDFLSPLPQLQKRWCSWNSTSPFTKLVDTDSSFSAAQPQDDAVEKELPDTTLQNNQLNSCKPEPSFTSASHPQSVQRQRYLNPAIGLWRARFTGLLSPTNESSSPPGSTTPACRQHLEPNGCVEQDVEGQVEDDCVPASVFGPSEEDRQLLVLAEHRTQQDSPKRSRGLAEAPVRLAKEPFSLRARSEWMAWRNPAPGDATPTATEESKSAIPKNASTPPSSVGPIRTAERSCQKSQCPGIQAAGQRRLQTEDRRSDPPDVRHPTAACTVQTTVND